MSSFAGMLFLLGGIALFVAAVLLFVAWERASTSGRRSVERYQRTSHSLRKIHRTQTTLRESARARARAMHPSARVRAARKETPDRRYA